MFNKKLKILGRQMLPNILNGKWEKNSVDSSTMVNKI